MLHPASCKNCLWRGVVATDLPGRGGGCRPRELSKCAPEESFRARAAAPSTPESGPRAATLSSASSLLYLVQLQLCIAGDSPRMAACAGALVKRESEYGRRAD